MHRAGRSGQPSARPSSPVTRNAFATLQAGSRCYAHCVGPLGVGTLVVVPRRHVVHMSDLDPQDSAELGRLLTRTSRVVTELSRPQQVYACLWSHAGGVPVHIHFVVQPVTRALSQQHGGALGPALQAAMFERGEIPDRAATAEYADRARAAFGSSADPDG